MRSCANIFDSVFRSKVCDPFFSAIKYSNKICLKKFTFEQNVFEVNNKQNYLKKKVQNLVIP